MNDHISRIEKEFRELKLLVNNKNVKPNKIKERTNKILSSKTEEDLEQFSIKTLLSFSRRLKKRNEKAIAEFKKLLIVDIKNYIDNKEESTSELDSDSD